MKLTYIFVILAHGALVLTVDRVERQAPSRLSRVAAGVNFPQFPAEYTSGTQHRPDSSDYGNSTEQDERFGMFFRLPNLVTCRATMANCCRAQCTATTHGCVSGVAVSAAALICSPPAAIPVVPMMECRFSTNCAACSSFACPVTTACNAMAGTICPPP